MTAGRGALGLMVLWLQTCCSCLVFLPDSISYSAVFSACDVDLQWQQALGLLAVMRQTGNLPGAVSYSAVISACENDQHWQQAWGLLELMQQTCVLLGVMSCSTMISA